MGKGKPRLGSGDLPKTTPLMSKFTYWLPLHLMYSAFVSRCVRLFNCFNLNYQLKKKINVTTKTDLVSTYKPCFSQERIKWLLGAPFPNIFF
jgi:hypothetical protein